MAEIHLIEPEKIVEKAEALGKQFSRKVKTHQLRNFYSSITQIRQDWKQNKDAMAVSSKLVMLQPKLAYAAGRQSDVKDFAREIIGEISSTRASIKALEDKINTQQDQANSFRAIQAGVIENFFSLIEGIVAYHKFYGGD